MLRKPLFWFLILPIVALGIWLVLLPGKPTESPVNREQYTSDLLSARRDKNQFMRTNAESPIVDKTTFPGLAYFDPDPAYRVTAQLDIFPAASTQKVIVPLTDGSEEVYEKYAHATFSLNGQACRLLVLRYQKTLTILFQDATSGKETYGGGRYMDVDPNLVDENKLTLDFNTAYNPYCAYNATYACPLPPAENKLSVAIRAGERYVAHE